MNRRLCVWVGSILGFFSLASFLAGFTVAQVAAPAATGTVIPPAALGAATEGPYASAIKGFITEQLAALSGPDFTAQTAAREKLKGALTRGDSPAYYSAFAKDWCAACAALIAKNPTVGVRLNVGIVSATLADNGQALDAQPIVMQLLNDREPCVVLWGIKAARPLIMLIVQNPPVGAVPAITASPLPAAIVAAVKSCGKSDVSGFATADAYSALVVKEVAGLTEMQVKDLRPPLVKPVLDILAFRVSQHVTGSVQAPGAEREIGTWLSGVYPKLDPKEQQRVVQLLVMLEAYAGQRADLYQNNKKELSQLREMLKYVTSALKVIGGQPVGSRLDWLTGMPPSAPPADIYQHTQQVFGTMQLAFSYLTAPTTIPVIEPPPPPTTKPTTPTAGP